MAARSIQVAYFHDVTTRYVGRDMKTSHAGLGITEKDWDASVKLLVATLDKFNVPAREGRSARCGLGPEEGYRREALARRVGAQRAFSGYLLRRR
jgi:hypothetical protein